MNVRKIERMGFQLQVKDPFIVCFHHKDHFPKGNAAQEPIDYLPNRRVGQDFDHNAPWRMYHGDTVPGFPVHPHKGFETVTVVTEGFVDHFDAIGGKGRYGEGDVQWMSAGNGTQHSEMFPVISTEHDNPMELFQIWINLSAAGKRTAPDYKMLWNERIPDIRETDAKGNSYRIRLIAGRYKAFEAESPTANSWAADPNNRVGIWLITLEPHATLTIPSQSTTLNRMLYNYRGGAVEIEGQTLASNFCADLNGAADIVMANGDATTHLLLLEGEPIGEPVASYGPFVMNTRAEIEESFREYRETEYGGWPWDRNDPVNAADDGRFASYNHGERVERP